MSDAQMDVARIGTAALAVEVMLGAIDAGFISASGVEPHGLALAAVLSCGIFLYLWLYLSFCLPQHQTTAYNSAAWPAIGMSPAPARNLQLSSRQVALTHGCPGHS